MLYCFANRSSLNESCNSMDEKFFLKKIDFTSIYFFKKVILWKKIGLQDAFRLENNGIVTFKINCRPDFQDENVLMFAGMFLRVLALFQTIPK